MYDDSTSSCGLLEDSLVHISMRQTIYHKKETSCREREQVQDAIVTASANLNPWNSNS